ncbi:unnamed protein product [Rotaria sp. Silwood2]|nr:unnamed protein product [Rotaria sp. Silwood2]CAF4437367.1 unnamed protein product [Rotaria sp. Silwood2]
MPNLRKLTLNIRDTSDPRFSHGLTMESMLIKHVSRLDKFDYTMTHRISNKTSIEDFIPWPSNRQDQRKVPIINGKYNISVTSDVKYTHYVNHVNITTNDEMLKINEKFNRVRELTTCLSIDRKLPRQITKRILSVQTSISSMMSTSQEHIRHLIVERRLTDENEIQKLAHQFPNVEYLELLFPLEKSSFLRCFQTLFRFADNHEKRCFWSEMISFRTRFTYAQSYSIWSSNELHYWLISNTDLKFRPNRFHTDVSDSTFSIWL